MHTSLCHAYDIARGRRRPHASGPGAGKHVLVTEPETDVADTEQAAGAVNLELRTSVELRTSDTPQAPGRGSMSGAQGAAAQHPRN